MVLFMLSLILLYTFQPSGKLPSFHIVADTLVYASKSSIFVYCVADTLVYASMFLNLSMWMIKAILLPNWRIYMVWIITIDIGVDNASNMSHYIGEY